MKNSGIRITFSKIWCSFESSLNVSAVPTLAYIFFQNLNRLCVFLVTVVHVIVNMIILYRKSVFYLISTQFSPASLSAPRHLSSTTRWILPLRSSISRRLMELVQASGWDPLIKIYTEFLAS